MIIYGGETQPYYFAEQRTTSSSDSRASNILAARGVSEDFFAVVRKDMTIKAKIAFVELQCITAHQSFGGKVQMLLGEDKQKKFSGKVAVVLPSGETDFHRTLWAVFHRGWETPWLDFSRCLLS